MGKHWQKKEEKRSERLRKSNVEGKSVILRNSKEGSEKVIERERESIKEKKERKEI